MGIFLGSGARHASTASVGPLVVLLLALLILQSLGWLTISGGNLRILFGNQPL